MGSKYFNPAGAALYPGGKSVGGDAGAALMPTPQFLPGATAGVANSMMGRAPSPTSNMPAAPTYGQGATPSGSKARNLPPQYAQPVANQLRQAAVPAPNAPQQYTR